MALIRLSLTEIVALLKQNISLPTTIGNIRAVNHHIEIMTVYGMTFIATYQSYYDGWLELEVKGTGWVGKLISVTFGAKLLDILAPQLIASGVAQTRGESIFLDTYVILGKIKGLRIGEILNDGDGLTIVAETKDNV